MIAAMRRTNRTQDMITPVPEYKFKLATWTAVQYGRCQLLCEFLGATGVLSFGDFFAVTTRRVMTYLTYKDRSTLAGHGTALTIGAEY